MQTFCENIPKWEKPIRTVWKNSFILTLFQNYWGCKIGKIVYFAPTKASLGVQVHPRAPSGVRPWSRLGHNVCNANLLYGDLHLGSSTGFTTSNFSFMSFPSGAVTFTTILNTLEVVSPLRVLIGMLLAVSFLSWIKYLLEVFYMYFRYSMFFQNNCPMRQ